MPAERRSKEVASTVVALVRASLDSEASLENSSSRRE